jgi:hypothetical protein
MLDPRELREFSNTSLVGVSSPEISNIIEQPDGASWSHIFILIEPSEGVSNTAITFSLAVVDPNDTEAWLSQQIVVLRELPDESKIVDLIVYETMHAKRFRLALESEITGGTVTVKTAFGAL